MLRHEVFLLLLVSGLTSTDIPLLVLTYSTLAQHFLAGTWFQEWNYFIGSLTSRG
jgi:hypothetical protein